VTVQQLWGPADEARAQALALAAHQEDLEAGLFAIEGADPDLQAACVVTLDQWGERLEGALRRRDLRSNATAMVQLLGRDLDLRGPEAGYHELPNSHLTRVVERRRGMPILLASVWVLVGQRAGVAVQGVGLPGHYIARVGGDDGVLVDPFQGGRPMSVGECRELLSRSFGGRLAWSDELLEATPPSLTLARVLRNLVHASGLAQDSVGLYQHARLALVLAPEEPSLHLAHARAAEGVGAIRLALDLYEDMLNRFPKTQEAAWAATRLGPLHTRARQVH
jgi:regulator of sirC expression with transglutaminase-like and TPR domain